MSATIGPIEVTCPLWTAVYDGTGGAASGTVLSVGGAPAIIRVAATAPDIGDGGMEVSTVGIPVAVGENEILWGRAYGEDGTVTAVIFTPAA